MRGGIVGMAGAWLLLCGFAKPEGDVPVIIVGSGFGGSIAAYNLAQHGVEAVVLERGRWWTVEDPTQENTFATMPSVVEGDGKSSWLSESCRGNAYVNFPPPGTFKCAVTTGIIETVEATDNPNDRSPAIRAEGIAPLAASGVGGGSLVYNGVSYPPLKAAWDVAYPANELPFMEDVWTELNKHGYFDEVLSVIAPTPIPQDLLDSEPYAGTRLLRDFAVAAGYPLEDGTREPLYHGTVIAPVAVSWDAVRDELAGKRAPSTIAGEAWFGINSDAKRSLDKPDNYLGLAIATGKVEVKALHTVTRIQFDPKTDLYHVEVMHTDLDYNELERFELTTRHLIVSAGSIGTTKLLVRARDTGDLPRLNEYVGTRWSSNGNANSFRFISDGVAPQGGPAGIKIVNYDDPQNPVVFENLPQRVPDFFASDPSLAPFLGASFNIGLGIPTATGHWRYEADTDTVVLSWPPEAGAKVYDKFISIMNELGGTPYIVEQPASQQYTAHPLGGVPLGLATDLNCRVHGYDQLYAVDGSLVPGSGAATNPSILIAALAQRCMDRVVTKIIADL
ncbi:MAG: GMC oxidoreductase [Polyangiales bacterium]